MSIGLQSQYPFFPLAGSTISFTANVALPSPVQSTAGLGLYLIQNASAQVVLVGWGISSAAATTAAGSLATSLPILPYTTQIIAVERNAWFTGSASSASLMYITAGYGI